MHKKRTLVLGWYLSLLALAACGPKVIDDADVVSIDYVYSFEDWTVIEQWSKNITIWDAWDLKWVEDMIRWAKVESEFNGNINWSDLYEHNDNLVQAYANIILTEVMWVKNPQIWTEVDVNSIWHWVITRIEKDKDWYNEYVVDFNDPKTYSVLLYSVKVTNIEKN